MDNTEHSISFSSNSGDITEEKTQVEFDKNKILPNDGENAEIEKPDNGNNGGVKRQKIQTVEMMWRKYNTKEKSRQWK